MGSNMENVLICIIVVGMACIGIYTAVRHLGGQGGCCGGGSYRPRKKKLSHVIARKEFAVEGMHCKHCKNRVEEVVNDIKGVAGTVDLKRGTVTVSYAEEVVDERIKARIEKAGYRVR